MSLTERSGGFVPNGKCRYVLGARDKWGHARCSVETTVEPVDYLLNEPTVGRQTYLLTTIRTTAEIRRKNLRPRPLCYCSRWADRQFT